MSNFTSINPSQFTQLLNALNNGGGGGGDAYTKQETDELLSNKVDKVTGKGLTTNDFTDEEKNKLNGLSNYDDTEVRNSIAEINSNLTKVVSKKIDISNVPITTSWGSNYISSRQSVDVSDLPLSSSKSVQITWISSFTSNLMVDSLSNTQLSFTLFRGTQANNVSGKIYINCYVDEVSSQALEV